MSKLDLNRSILMKDAVLAIPYGFPILICNICESTSICNDIKNFGNTSSFQMENDKKHKLRT